MLILHWLLCAGIAYAGFVRCIEMDGSFPFVGRLITAATPPASLLMAFKPQAFGLSFGGWSLIVLLIILLGVLAEIQSLRTWVAKKFLPSQIVGD